MILLVFWQHLILKLYQMFDHIILMPKLVFHREFQKEILLKRNCGDYKKSSLPQFAFLVSINDKLYGTTVQQENSKYCYLLIFLCG